MEELTDLREQMASMKRSIDKYEIINNRLMRTVMRQRSKWINNLFIIEILIYPLLILFLLAVTEAFGLSIWITIVFGVFAAISTTLDYKTLRISPRMISDCNLLAMRTKLLRQKTMRSIQFWIELPLSLIWGIWFIISFMHSNPQFADFITEPVFLWIEGIMITGFLITTIVILLILFRKLQQTNDSLIDDIDSTDQPPLPPQ